MTEINQERPLSNGAGASSSGRRSEVYAAVDLGTNNCRLLIATPRGRGFKVIDAFSRIVRLGEGVSQTGRLAEPAMERAIEALAICADKIRRRGVSQLRAVATQACRSAANGAYFLEAVAQRTGLRLEVITAEEEAQLAVAGCVDLIDPAVPMALILDVGGGSTELSWLELPPARPGDPMIRPPPPVSAWYSAPLGVVTLVERFPPGQPGDLISYRAMVEAVKLAFEPFAGADRFREVFQAGGGHIVGTSGAITTLAALHLGLAKYDRTKVDGLWMTRGECEAVAKRLANMTVPERAAEPCVGPDRADLVLAGAAILQGVQELWPCERVRVADRGLREGLLLDLIAAEVAERTRRERSGRPQRRLDR